MTQRVCQVGQLFQAPESRPLWCPAGSTANFRGCIIFRGAAYAAVILQYPAAREKNWKFYDVIGKIALLGLNCFNVLLNWPTLDFLWGCRIFERGATFSGGCKICKNLAKKMGGPNKKSGLTIIFRNWYCNGCEKSYGLKWHTCPYCNMPFSP